MNNPDDGTIVTAQSIAAKTTYDGTTELVLEVGKSGDTNSQKVKVPDLTGMNVQEANELLGGLGLKLKIDGSGFAKSQNPAADTEVDKGSEISVTFSQ